MITTSGSVTIHKTLRIGVSTAYSLARVSLFIYSNGVQKRFNATALTNSTSVLQGVISFNDIPLWGDGNYSFYITVEDVVDLDTNSAALNKIGSGYIKKITNTNIKTV